MGVKDDREQALRFMARTSRETPVEVLMNTMIASMAQTNQSLISQTVPYPTESGDDHPSSSKNETMYLISSEGPFYATIVVPGTRDTKSGPQTDRHARMLDGDGEPIPGAYAVGDCAANPSACGYWAGGATLGPFVTFAWLAGQHVAKQSNVATGV
jgi:hypothetical protein